jgi:segment polarity protein dishevelled
MMLKSGFIRHTVNKLTFSEQCYYVFGELVSSLAAMQIRDEDNKSMSASEVMGPLPPPSTTSPACWSNPYSSTSIHQPPIYAPMPYMTGGYESNAYSYPQEPSLHSGSGKTSRFSLPFESCSFSNLSYLRKLACSQISEDSDEIVVNRVL